VYPKRIKQGGAIRTQYGHVIDILPTTLEVLGLKASDSIRGIHQQPVEGTSLAYSIDDANAPSRHRTQYYYIFGSRAIYQDGWKASLGYPNHFETGLVHTNKPFDENGWELYNLNDDYTERLNLAQKNPEKLGELRALFEQQAQSHHLYPLITWDDVINARIHHNKNSKSLLEEFQKVTTHTN
jgi:arylsulfatase